METVSDVLHHSDVSPLRAGREGGAGSLGESTGSFWHRKVRERIGVAVSRLEPVIRA